MTQEMQPEEIQGLPSSVRSDLASIWRTVEWHLVEPSRVATANHVGATCNRLLRRCLANDELTEDTRQELLKMSERLTQLDAAVDADKEALLLEVCLLYTSPSPRDS